MPFKRPAHSISFAPVCQESIYFLPLPISFYDSSVLVSVNLFHHLGSRLPICMSLYVYLAVLLSSCLSVSLSIVESVFCLSFSV